MNAIPSGSRIESARADIAALEAGGVAAAGAWLADRRLSTFQQILVHRSRRP